MDDFNGNASIPGAELTEEDRKINQLTDAIQKSIECPDIYMEFLYPEHPNYGEAVSALESHLLQYDSIRIRSALDLFELFPNANCQFHLMRVMKCPRIAYDGFRALGLKPLDAYTHVSLIPICLVCDGDVALHDLGIITEENAEAAKHRFDEYLNPRPNQVTISDIALLLE